MTLCDRLKAMADDTDLSDQERATCAEAARVLAKLPVTSDGAPIVPGMRLWWVIGQMIDSATINPGGGISTWRDSLSFYNDTMASYCIPLPCTYSTKEAASAAALAVAAGKKSEA